MQGDNFVVLLLLFFIFIICSILHGIVSALINFMKYKEIVKNITQFI